MKHVYIVIMFLLAFASCEDADRDAYSLVRSEEEFSFELDRNTLNWSLAMGLYTDRMGEEYLTFLNRGQNEILFYSWKDKRLKFKICPKVDGNNGVGFVNGYYIHSLDSIFLSVSGLPEIPLINRQAEVVDKLACEMTTDGIPVARFTSGTRHPFVVKDQVLYLLPGCDRWARHSPMRVGIDLATKEIHRYPLDYPRFEGADNRAKRAGVELYVSSCFTGNKYVYSFYYDESVYVTSLDQEEVERIPVKSKYVDKIVLPDDYNQVSDNQGGFKEMCENANYGSMRYDPYRDVYYRVAYPKTEIEPGVNTMELMQYGRKVFSIIIADNRFNVIGETLFPAYRYNPDMMFIREDGLYISASHPMSPDFSDDELRFHRFELRKK